MIRNPLNSCQTSQVDSSPIIMKQDGCILFLSFFLEGDVDATTQAKQKQSVKILELLVYTAAQTGAKQFIEMIFSTSAQRIVFDSYKERATLPEDVARANGHCDLAEYLEDITMRYFYEHGQVSFILLPNDSKRYHLYCPGLDRVR